jgi:hypothetical protein
MAGSTVRGMSVMKSCAVMHGVDTADCYTGTATGLHSVKQQQAGGHLSHQGTCMHRCCKCSNARV